MAEDLGKKFQAQLDKMRQDIDRLQRTNPLESASVTSGRVRFAGGLLRIDSGGRVEIVGTLEIDGTTTVSGSFDVTGPWELAGDGTITGNVTGTGTLTWNGPWNLAGTGTITGPVSISGILTLLSDLVISGGGKITAGNVVIEPNKITVAGADGPTILQDSRMDFNNGSSFRADVGSGVRMQAGSTTVSCQAASASMGVFGRTFSINASGYRMTNMPTIGLSSAGAGAFVGAMVMSDTGFTFRVVAD